MVMATYSNATPDSAAQFTFTVFVPAYNRAHTLQRAYDSVVAQNRHDLELVVVDDGSTDGTQELVKRWQASAPFPVVYHRQPNQGKHAAHNAGVQMARGELFVLLDSDDMLAPDALERILRHWSGIPAERRHEFAGIEGLCVDMRGNISGDRFPRDVMESNYFEVRNFLHIGGEKKHAILTSVLREYPYPVFPGERHIRDSLLWERISEHYKFLYVNEVLQIFEYQPEGLTANIQKVRMANPVGFRFYYLEDVRRPARYFTLSHRLDSYMRYARFSLHCGVGLAQQWREVPNRWLWLAMLPQGYVKWLADCRRGSAR